MTLVFTPNHMYPRGKGMEERVELASLFGAVETRTKLLMRQSALASYIIPKRFYSDRESLKQVRDCLRKGFPGTATIMLSND